MATTNEKELLRFIGMVNCELDSILDEFDTVEITESRKIEIDENGSLRYMENTPVLEIGEYKIEAVKFAAEIDETIQ